MNMYSTLCLTHNVGFYINFNVIQCARSCGVALFWLSAWSCCRELHIAVHSVPSLTDCLNIYAMSRFTEPYHGTHTCSFHKCRICCLMMKYESAHETVMGVLNRYMRASNPPHCSIAVIVEPQEPSLFAEIVTGSR